MATAKIAKPRVIKTVAPAMAYRFMSSNILVLMDGKNTTSKNGITLFATDDERSVKMKAIIEFKDKRLSQWMSAAFLQRVAITLQDLGAVARDDGILVFRNVLKAIPWTLAKP
jgi:hypothetical protein